MKRLRVHALFAGVGAVAGGLILLFELPISTLHVQDRLRENETRSYLFSDPDRAEKPLPKLTEDLMLDGFHPPVQTSEYASRVTSLGGTHGLMEVTLAWEGYNDVDLAIMTPSGKRIDANQRNDGYGTLDLDYNYTPLDEEGQRRSASGNAIGREHTLPMEQGESAGGKFSAHPVEHVVWGGREPEHGHYKVLVQHFFNREKRNSTDIAIEVSQNGILVGRQTSTLAARDVVESGDAEVIAFEFDYPYVPPKKTLPPNEAIVLGPSGRLDRIDAANGKLVNARTESSITNIAAAGSKTYGLDGRGRLYEIGEDGLTKALGETGLTGVSGLCGVSNGLLASSGSKLYFINPADPQGQPMLETGAAGQLGDMAWDDEGGLWSSAGGSILKIDIASRKFHRLKAGLPFPARGLAAGSQARSLVAFGPAGQVATINLRNAEFTSPTDPEDTLGAVAEASSLAGSKLPFVAAPKVTGYLDHAISDLRSPWALGAGLVWPLGLACLVFFGLVLGQTLYGRKALLPLRESAMRFAAAVPWTLAGGLAAHVAYSFIPIAWAGRLLAWTLIGLFAAGAFRCRMPNLSKKWALVSGLMFGLAAGALFQWQAAYGSIPRLLAALAVGTGIGVLIHLVRPAIEKIVEATARQIHQLRAPYQRAQRPQITPEVNS